MGGWKCLLITVGIVLHPNIVLLLLGLVSKVLREKFDSESTHLIQRQSTGVNLHMNLHLNQLLDHDV